MRRIVLDMKGGLLAEAVMQSLSGCDPDFLVYRSSKPEETLALCRNCRANVLVMEVIRPIYRRLAAYGPFGENGRGMPWERTDLRFPAQF